MRKPVLHCTFMVSAVFSRSEVSASLHAIIDTARENDCDLIVMGSHGHGGFKHLMLGSETTRVLSHTKIPVLVYR